MKIHEPFGDPNEHTRRFQENPDAGGHSAEALLVKGFGKLVKWMTIVAAIWSYRAWEPFFVRGMGRMYWGGKQFAAGLFCLIVFPYWWIAVMPTLLALLHIVPGANLIAYPVAKFFPDGLAFLGIRERAATATAIYNNNDSPISDVEATIPSFAEVFNRTAGESSYNTINEWGAEMFRLAVWVLPRSLVESMWLLLKWDFAAYCGLIVAFLYFSHRHFKDTRLVKNTGYEGEPVRPLLPRRRAGKWIMRKAKVPVPLMLAAGGIMAILLGFSLCGAFAIFGAMSYTFFRGRIADRRRTELHASLASEHASKQTERDKKELQNMMAEEAEAMRREIEEKERRRVARKGDGADSPSIRSAGGVEIARPVYSNRPRKGASKAPDGLLPRVIKSLTGSVDPVDKELLAQLLMAAKEQEKSIR